MSSKAASFRSKAQKGNGCLGVGVSLFSLLFIVAGLATAFQQAQLWNWKEVPCQIESSEIIDTRENDSPFEARVSYRYRWQGRQYTSDRLSTGESATAKQYEDLVETVRRATQRGTCYLDPNKPEEAILQRKVGGIWAGLFFAILGSFFFVIGIAVMRRRKKATEALSATAAGPFFEKGKFATVGTFLFFASFALAGSLVLLLFVLPSAQKYLSAKGWQPTPATVVWSEVRSESTDDGTVYRPDIFYRYQFEGEEHRSNSFAFFAGSSSGSEGKRETVRDYPSGHQFTCYVNPRKPWQALIERQIGWSALFALFPLPFLAIGFGGLFQVLRDRQRRGQSTETPSSAAATTAPGASGPSQASTERAPSLQRNSTAAGRGKFIGHLFFALFWCGIVSIFVVIAWGKWSEGNPEWLLNLFLVPFILVGLGALFSLPYSFLAIFSPRFALNLRDPVLKPGMATQLRWRKIAGSGELTHLTLTLHGEEQASYRQGTDTATATSTFYAKELRSTSNLPEILGNECDLIIPADALPSFKGTNNKISWFVHIHAKVRARPDVRDSIALTIHPYEETDFR